MKINYFSLEMRISFVISLIFISSNIRGNINYAIIVELIFQVTSTTDVNLEGPNLAIFR
jgi:hypothetical protein